MTKTINTLHCCFRPMGKSSIDIIIQNSFSRVALQKCWIYLSKKARPFQNQWTINFVLINWKFSNLCQLIFIESVWVSKMEQFAPPPQKNMHTAYMQPKKQFHCNFARNKMRKYFRTSFWCNLIVSMGPTMSNGYEMFTIQFNFSEWIFGFVRCKDSIM